MTCIAGIAQGGIVHLGADTQATADTEIFERADDKLFALGDYVIGFSGSYRIGQIIRYSFDAPVFNRNVYDSEHEFMVTNFVPTVIRTLKSYDVLGTERPVSMSGELLIGLRGKLFSVGDDFQVGMERSQYDGIGSGGLVARASLFSTADMLLSPAERVSLAVRAAGRLLSDCSAEGFVYMATKKVD